MKYAPNSSSPMMYQMQAIQRLLERIPFAMNSFSLYSSKEKDSYQSVLPSLKHYARLYPSSHDLCLHFFYSSIRMSNTKEIKRYFKSLFPSLYNSFFDESMTALRSPRSIGDQLQKSIPSQSEVFSNTCLQPQQWRIEKSHYDIDLVFDKSVVSYLVHLHPPIPHQSLLHRTRLLLPESCIHHPHARPFIATSFHPN